MIVTACQWYRTPVLEGRALYAFWCQSCNVYEECVYDTITGDLIVYDIDSEEELRSFIMPVHELMKYLEEE